MKQTKTKDVTIKFGDGSGDYELEMCVYSGADHLITLREVTSSVKERYFVHGFSLAQLKAAIAELEKELAV